MILSLRSINGKRIEVYSIVATNCSHPINTGWTRIMNLSVDKSQATGIIATFETICKVTTGRKNEEYSKSSLSSPTCSKK